MDIDIEIARCLVEVGRFTEAEEILKKILRKKSLNIETQAFLNSQLAYLYRRNNNFKKALKYALKSKSLVEMMHG